jgi:hypothetical protein
MRRCDLDRIGQQPANATQQTVQRSRRGELFDGDGNGTR